MRLLSDPTETGGEPPLPPLEVLLPVLVQLEPGVIRIESVEQ
jgi:hypothetical protein